MSALNLHKKFEKCDQPAKDQSELPEYCQVLRFKDSSGQMKEMIFPKGLDLDRPKRPRTTFTEEQLNALEEQFVNKPYLVGKERTELAELLDLSETQIKVWFQNRRTKSKRDRQSSTETDGSDDVITSSTASPESDLCGTKSYVSPSGYNQAAAAHWLMPPSAFSHHHHATAMPMFNPHHQFNVNSLGGLTAANQAFTLNQQYWAQTGNMM